MSIKSYNPYTNELIKEFTEISDEELTTKLENAQSAFENWRQKTIQERLQFIQQLLDVMNKNTDKYAKVITEEVGKPFSQSVAEVKKCCLLIQYYLDNAEKHLSPEVYETEASECYVRFDPLGVLLGVMPWNFPFWQAYRFLVPSIIAGNTCVLKHASNVPLTAIAIEETFKLAGMNTGEMQTLLISSSKVERIIADPIIKAVSLTGSEGAGSSVASIAGKYLKKCVLELGGSDPFIVLPGADLEKAADEAEASRLRNAGQACNSAKRYIVHQEVADEFLQLVKERFSKYIPTDPYNEDALITCMSSQNMFDEVKEQVQDALDKGAILVSPEELNLEDGLKMPGILLDNVDSSMKVYTEEVFGPVGILIRVGSVEEAVQVANSSDYGLAASLWTPDMGLAKFIIPQLETGNVYINKRAGSDPRLPFGGIGKSGYGRELSIYGIREFVNVKTVWIA